MYPYSGNITCAVRVHLEAVRGHENAFRVRESSCEVHERASTYCTGREKALRGVQEYLQRPYRACRGPENVSKGRETEVMDMKVPVEAARGLTGEAVRMCRNR